MTSSATWFLRRTLVFPLFNQNFLHCGHRSSTLNRPICIKQIHQNRMFSQINNLKTKRKTRSSSNCSNIIGGIPYALSFSLFGLLNTSSTTEETPPTNSDILELVKQGKMSLSKGEHPRKAEMLYSRALHLALETKNKPVVAYVMDLLANIALEMNQLDKAEPLFRDVLKNLISSGTSQTAPEVLEISLKLASIYARNGQKELAVSGYRFSADACRNNLKEMEKKKLSPKDKDYQNSLALLGMILDSYGRFLHDIHENESALAATLEAIDISEKLFGDKNMKTLVLYNDISSIKSEMGKFDEALSYARKAIDLTEANPSVVEPTEKAVFYANLAYIYIKKGSIEDADKAYKQALIEASKTNDQTLKTHVASLINVFPSEKQTG